MLSIALWIIAQLPQFIANYKNKSTEALSPWFLAEWLMGDTTNLLGALLQGEQLPTTLYTAMYFVMSDAVLLMQFVYYGALQRRREKILLLQVRRQRRRQQQRRPPPGAGDGGSGPGGASLVGGGAKDVVFIVETDDGLDGAAHQRQTGNNQSQNPQQQQQQLVQQHSLARCGSSGGGAPLHHMVTLGCAQQQQQQQRRRHTCSGPASPSGRCWVLPAAALVTLSCVSLLSSRSAAGSGGAPAPCLHAALAAVASGTAGVAAATANALSAWVGSMVQDSADWMPLVGTALGWASATLYIMSRVSQVYKTLKRRSAEGLAFGMFLLAACANVCTGTAILLRSYTLEQVRLQAPWLVGAYGTIALDCIILVQSVVYGTHGGGGAHSTEAMPGAAADMEEPLLTGQDP